MTQEERPLAVVRQMQVGPMANFVYLICCERTKEAAVVDPAWDAGAIIGAAERAGYRITKAFATHSHFDHVNAAAALQEKTGAQLYANEHEVAELAKSGLTWTAVKADERVLVGEAEVRCLHTPGHTPGSQCLLVEAGAEGLPARVLTGDTLFIGNIGRCDLPGSSPDALYHSLMRLKELPPETILLPGHNYADKPSSTIGEQAQRNMYLRIPSAEAFLHVLGV